jgi:subtilisin family serine protease
MCKLNLPIVSIMSLLAACDVGLESAPDPMAEQPGFEPDGPSQLAEPEQAPTVPVALVVGNCPGAQRLIGVLAPGSNDCSLGGTIPNQWSASMLFASGSPSVAALAEPVPTELGRFCAFDFTGDPAEVGTAYTGLTAAVDASPDMDVATLSTDCRGEFEQANLYDPSIGAELRSAFLANIGWSEGTHIDQTHALRAPIDVAIVDTVSQIAADDPNIEPANVHGLQMAALIGAVACPAGRSSCLDGVRHELALPRNDWSAAPDWTVGGRHGSQGDLAMAIYAAVEAWRERRLAAPNASAPRLVVNLSIGWMGLGDEPLLSERGPHAAVLAAMRFASCHGALLIAAAGNSEDELCPDQQQGPLAPARFEALAAPSQLECATLGYVPQWTVSYPIFAAPGSYAPLVHAVGALDEFDEPLINSRDGGMPRLAALGANGITDPSADTLSGSSVSAALVSATAALLWSYRPELRPDQILETIHAAGWDLGYSADFSLANDVRDVHRLSVCAALDDVCAGQGNHCPTPLCSATAPASDGNLGGVADAIEAVLEHPQTNVEIVVDPAAREWPTCDGGGGDGTTDLTSPQPEMPICSRCDLGKGGGFTTDDDRLSMTIDPSYAGAIVGVTLITVDDLGARSFRTFGEEVGKSLNDQPEPVDVTVVYVDEPNAVSASLQFELVDGSIQTNRITVTEATITTTP